MNSIAILTNQLFSISTGDPTYGGGERYCLSLANHLTSLGFCVDFFQFDYPNSVKKYHGYEVNGILPTTGYSEFSSGTCTKFTEKTKKYTYVIHALPECSSGVVRSDALMISHGIWFDQNQAGYKFRTAEWYEHLTRAFTSPQHIVSVDTNTINVIRALIPGLDDKFHYIPNFVDTNAFYPRKTEHKLRVTFPRRDHPLRGGALVPEIMNNIKSDCEFWWVGGNNPCKDARLKCFIKPFDEMPEVYQQSDIVVIPTLGAKAHH